MCYSAEASFAASGVLAINSIAISRLPKEKSSLPLSMVPAIFAVHQFTEGLVWLGQDGNLLEAYKWVAIYTYVIIAFVLWPIYVPFAAYIMESSKRRRAVILLCQAIGLWVGLTLLLSIFRDPITVAADCCRLSYGVKADESLLIPYLVAVSVPFLLSTRRGLVYFGAGITISCAAAYYLTTETAFPSLWCFFAALLSGGLYFYFKAAARTIVNKPVVSNGYVECGG